MRFLILSLITFITELVLSSFIDPIKEIFSDINFKYSIGVESRAKQT